jgi:hypothetical protein
MVFKVSTMARKAGTVTSTVCPVVSRAGTVVFRVGTVTSTAGTVLVSVGTLIFRAGTVLPKSGTVERKAGTVLFTVGTVKTTVPDIGPWHVRSRSYLQSTTETARGTDIGTCGLLAHERPPPPAPAGGSFDALALVRTRAPVVAYTHAHGFLPGRTTA